MKQAILSSALEVTDPRVGAAFADPLRRRLVLLLAAQPRSLAELANHTGIDLKRLHYHVNALLDLGLVIVRQKRARAGRAIKVYGAVAAAFWVPSHVSVIGPEVALMAELGESLRKRHAHLAGTLYYLDESGAPKMRPVSAVSARHSTAKEYWRILKLSKDQLSQLTATIEACLMSISKQSKGGGHSYLMHFAIAPRSRQ